MHFMRILCSIYFQISSTLSTKLKFSVFTIILLCLFQKANILNKRRKKPIEANSFISFEFYGPDIYVHVDVELTERIFKKNGFFTALLPQLV